MVYDDDESPRYWRDIPPNREVPEYRRNDRFGPGDAVAALPGVRWGKGGETGIMVRRRWWGLRVTVRWWPDEDDVTTVWSRQVRRILRGRRPACSSDIDWPVLLAP